MHTDLACLSTLVREVLAGRSVSTDSRELEAGSIFFALDGVRFRGAEFVKEALGRGADWVVTHEPSLSGDSRVLVVRDSLEALQVLAYMYRGTLGRSTRFLAVVGSNGKTTTKELMRAVLAQKYRVQATRGNLNNHIGVPLTLLSIRPETQLAIIEMGANHLGEIAGYCRIARPDFGVITNISRAHIGEFGSEERIFQAKTELYAYLAHSHAGAAGIFVNTDYPDLYRLAKQSGRCITYSSNYMGHAEAKLWGKILPSEHYFLNLSIEEAGQSYAVQTRLAGRYNLENVLAACSVGRYFQLDWTEIVQALEAYSPENLRSQLVNFQGNWFILDAYNANPTSMRLALEDLQARAVHDRQKLLVLGAMRELGSYSREEHRRIQDYVQQFEWECIFVGDQWETRDFGQYFQDSSQAFAYFKNCKFSGKLVLLKGSRAYKLEIFVGRQ